MNSVTIVIPTQDRAPFVARIAAYFGASGIRAIVADSSLNPIRDNATLRYLDYHHYPRASFAIKLLDALEKVDTPFVTLCADDDFLLPGAIAKCTEVLIDSPTVSTAHGHYLSFSCLKDGPVVRLERIAQGEIDDGKHLGYFGTNALDRLSAYFANYTQLVYSVHRKETVRAALEMISDDMENQFAEVAFGVVAMLRGSHAHVHDLYGVRQYLRSSGASRHTGLDEIFYGGKDVHDKELFIERCSSLIAREANVSGKDAFDHLLKCISSYLMSGVGTRAQWCWGQKQRRVKRVVLDHSGPVGPSLRALKHRIREPRLLKFHDFSLSADIQPSIQEMGELHKIFGLVATSPATYLI